MSFPICLIENQFRLETRYLPLPDRLPEKLYISFLSLSINHTYANVVFMWTSLEKDWGSTFLVVMTNFGCSVQSWTTTRLQLLLKEYDWLTRSNVLKSLSPISHVAAKQNHKRNSRYDHCMWCCEVLKGTFMRLSHPANRKKTSPPWQKPKSVRMWEHYKITTCCRLY